MRFSLRNIIELQIIASVIGATIYHIPGNEQAIVYCALTAFVISGIYFLEMHKVIKPQSFIVGTLTFSMYGIFAKAVLTQMFSINGWIH